MLLANSTGPHVGKVTLARREGGKRLQCGRLPGRRRAPGSRSVLIGAQGAAELLSQDVLPSLTPALETPGTPAVSLVAAATATLPEVPVEVVDAVEPATASASAAEPLASASSTLSDTLGATTSALTDSLSSTTSALTDSLSSTSSTITDTLSSTTSALTDTLGGTLSATTSALEDTSETITAALGSTLSATTSALEDTTESLSAAATAVTSAAGGAASAATGAITSALGTATSTLDGATSAVTSTVSSATAAAAAAASGATTAVASTFDAAKDGAAAAAASAAAATDAAIAGAFASLPPEVQSALAAASGAAVKAAQFAAAYPIPIAAGVTALAVPLTLNYLNARYGGYAGELDPFEAYDALLNEDAVLVDIRSDEQRMAEGLPELKLAARFKATVWQPVALDQAALRRFSNPKVLELEINAAYLSGIKLAASPLTKYIILDTTGSDTARDLARALRSVGIASPYVVCGGFRAWENSGLGVTTGGALVYEGNLVDYIGDELELLGQQALETVRPLQDPVVATTAGAALLAAGVAVYNYKTTLEWVGVLGLMASAANWVLQYDSPQDMLQDLQGSWNKLAAGAAAKKPAKPALQPVVKPIVPVEPAAVVAARSAATSSMSEEAEEKLAVPEPKAKPAVAAAAATPELNGAAKAEKQQEVEVPVANKSVDSA